MIAYVFPTRDRHDEVRRTLLAIDHLGSHAAIGGAEVLIADNASAIPLDIPGALRNGLPVHVLERSTNEAAAARNACVRAASPQVEWIVMLDDDSAPLDAGLFDAIREAPPDVAAIQAEIFLPRAEGEPQRHEAGGLPEVFIGCGVAIRRRVFEELGGYDATFDYYAEEYDLAARLIAAGHRISFDPRFRVLHRKVSTNRDFSRIVRRLVRNNAWVQARYTPSSDLFADLWETVSRYLLIARKERAVGGYLAGLQDLIATIADQPRTPLSREQYDRLTGLTHARAALHAAWKHKPFASAAVIAPGKNVKLIVRALREMGVETAVLRPGQTRLAERADVIVVGTLSPGPMGDAAADARLQFPAKRILLPWMEIGVRPAAARLAA
ncbi:MAG: glycosyltransferase [Phycisphaerales bacterium]|nr:glycosyltransferase [Phycisphaerales bacterium]